MIINIRPYEQNFSGNPIVYGWRDEEAINNPDLLFEVRVFFKDSSAGADWEQLASIPITPINGTATIDISNILHANLKLTLPDLNAPYTESTTQTGYFYVDYRRISISGDLDEPYNASEYESQRRVIWGGLHPFAWQGNNFWLDYFKAENKFLTWQLSDGLVGLNEKRWLAWFNDTGVAAANIRYQIRVTFTDRSVTTFYKPLPAVTNRLYFIACGIDQLGMDIPNNKGLWYWSVTVQNTTVPANPVDISQEYIFQVDNRNNYNDLVLHFRNSLGGFDSINIRGVIEENISLDGSEAEVSVMADWLFSNTLPIMDKSLPHLEIVSYKGDVGHLGKEAQDRLRDAFLNREVWQENNGRWWPVKLLTKQYRHRASNDKRFTKAIEFVTADGGSYYYTPKIDLGHGKNLRNVCAASIVDIVPSINYISVDTAEVTWAFNIQNPSLDLVKMVEYKLPGFIEQWQSSPVPPTFFKTLHNVPSTVTIYLRPVCDGGSAGSFAMETVDIPISGAPPTPINSTIQNNTGIANIQGSLTRDGFEVYSGRMKPETAFHCPNGMASFTLSLMLVSVASAVMITPDGSFPGARRRVGANTLFDWPNMNITNGVIIKFPA